MIIKLLEFLLSERVFHSLILGGIFYGLWQVVKMRIALVSYLQEMLRVNRDATTVSV